MHSKVWLENVPLDNVNEANVVHTLLWDKCAALRLRF
jgi:hypothetical protein